MKKFIISGDINPNNSPNVDLGLNPSEMKEETFKLLMDYLKRANMEYRMYFQGENFESLSFDIGAFNIYVFEDHKDN